MVLPVEPDKQRFCGIITAGANGDWRLLGNMGSVSEGLFANTSAGDNKELFGSSTQLTCGGLFGSSSTTGGGLFGSKLNVGSGSRGQFVESWELFGEKELSLLHGASEFFLLSFRTKTNPSVNQQTRNQLVLHTAPSNVQFSPDELNSVVAVGISLKPVGICQAYYASNAQHLEMTKTNAYWKDKNAFY